MDRLLADRPLPAPSRLPAMLSGLAGLSGKYNIRTNLYYRQNHLEYPGHELAQTPPHTLRFKPIARNEKLKQTPENEIVLQKRCRTETEIVWMESFHRREPSNLELFN